MALFLELFPLAITPHYGQSPAGNQPLAGRVPLAYNGYLVVYSQYISLPLWGFAKEEERRIIDLCYR
jgi:hypothetical protein